jgi:pyruvate formate lyase activating enzyme
MLGRVAYLKTSLIDFPGRLASVLFLSGCDFRCPYCHNAALVDERRAGAEDDLAPLKEFYGYLDKRKSLLSGVVISGGEPLLHEETPAIADAIREKGLAVKLDTNGSYPERIAAVGADYVALDLKTSRAAYGRVAPGISETGAKVLETLAYLRSSGTPFEIRVTCAPGIVGPSELEVLSLSFESGDEVLLQEFRPGGCLDPTFDRVEPYTRAEMEGLLAIVKRRVPKARVRGWR